MTMELSEVINTQFAFPGIVVGLVLICAALVFVFGFKSVDEFPFDKLTNATDDRKPAGKKRKVKDKKYQSNGQATTVVNEKTEKQKVSDASNKGSGLKSPPKEKKETETSPSKEKVLNKQDKKQIKNDASPAKIALKESKNIKENKKTSDENSIKVKKVNDNKIKDSNINKQAKSKGKENVDVKNKKNVEKSSKLKQEEKSKDIDDEGEWEQAVSRKDKKNRKPTSSDEETGSTKTGKKENTSPGKKTIKLSELEVKPANIEQLIAAEIPEADEAKVEEAKKEPKPSKKDQKKDKPKPAEVTIDVEQEMTPTESETEAKNAIKKKKKKAGKETTDVAPVENIITTVEPTEESPLPKFKMPEVEHKEITPTAAVDDDASPAFDELGDVWKEAKIPKKASKKKVRKDQ